MSDGDHPVKLLNLQDRNVPVTIRFVNIGHERRGNSLVSVLRVCPQIAQVVGAVCSIINTFCQLVRCDSR